MSINLAFILLKTGKKVGEVINSKGLKKSFLKLYSA